MKVNTFIVGAQKAGTTSLYEWLIQHPEVCGEIYLKDFPFFRDDYLFEKGYDHLEKKFTCKKNQKIVITGCVDYIENIKYLKRIHDYNPKAKIIYLVREPKSRIKSAFNFLTQLDLEHNKNINDAIEQKIDYLNRSLYGTKTEQLLSMFPKDQIQLVLFEKMAMNPKETIQEVFKFLNLPNEDNISFFIANATKEPRFKKINKFLYDIESNKAIRAFVRFIFPPALRLKIVRIIKDSNTKNSASKKTYGEIDDKYLEQIEKDKKTLKKYINFEGYW